MRSVLPTSLRAWRKSRAAQRLQIGIGKYDISRPRIPPPANLESLGSTLSNVIEQAESGDIGKT